LQRDYAVCIAAVLAGAICLRIDAAEAADTAEGNHSPGGIPWLLGDWNGVRTNLRSAGVDFQFGYVGETAGNAAGGVRRQMAYADQWAAGATLDLGRLGAIRDATVQVTFTDRNGSNLSDDAGLGTLQEVQEIYGRGQTARLTRFWYNQKFADGLVEWKIGRMPFSEDFAAFACDFQNLTFCGAPAGNIVTSYIYNWPISQWATRLKFNFADIGYFQFAAFDQNPKYLGLQQALLPVFFAGSTGVLVPAEFAWLPRFGGLQGSYKFGGWYDTSLAADALRTDNGGAALAQTSGRYGAYINFLQQVTYTDAANGGGGCLSLFFNATAADRRTAVVDAQFAGGLMYTGLFATRPNDDIGVAVGKTHVNSRVSWFEMSQYLAGSGPAPTRRSEYAFEAYYTWRPRSGLEIRPNIQYVIGSGGVAPGADALVFGLKTVANF
jgi:porin